MRRREGIGFGAVYMGGGAGETLDGGSSYIHMFSVFGLHVNSQEAARQKTIFAKHFE